MTKYQIDGLKKAVDAALLLKLMNEPGAKQKAFKIMNDYFYETKVGIQFAEFDRCSPHWRAVFQWVTLDDSIEQRLKTASSLMSNQPLRPVQPLHPWVGLEVELKKEHFQLCNDDFDEMGMTPGQFYCKCKVYEVGLMSGDFPNESDYVFFITADGKVFPHAPINFNELPDVLQVALNACDVKYDGFPPLGGWNYGPIEPVGTIK